MANVLPSLGHDSAAFSGRAAALRPFSSSFAAVAGAQPQGKDQRIASAEQLVLYLCDPQLRENALLDLSKKREIFQDLAPFTSLLQVDDTEVIGFLLRTEIIPLCLRAMEMGSELSQTASDQSYSSSVC